MYTKTYLRRNKPKALVVIHHCSLTMLVSWCANWFNILSDTVQQRKLLGIIVISAKAIAQLLQDLQS